MDGLHISCAKRPTHSLIVHLVIAYLPISSTNAFGPNLAQKKRMEQKEHRRYVIAGRGENI
jgi:hypothetical protein